MPKYRSLIRSNPFSKPIVSTATIPIPPRQTSGSWRDLPGPSSMSRMPKTGRIFSISLIRGRCPRKRSSTRQRGIGQSCRRSYGILTIRPEDAKSSGGEIALRRINRREYESTIKDLLGIRILALKLPDDASAASIPSDRTSHSVPWIWRTISSRVRRSCERRCTGH